MVGVRTPRHRHARNLSDEHELCDGNTCHYVDKLAVMTTNGSFRRLGTIFWGPYDKDPTI